MEETKNKRHVPTWLKLAGLAIPVLIPGIFNYFVSKMETDRANERAAMAYEAMVGTVSKLQDAVEKLSEAQADLKVAQAELKGRVEAGERFSNKVTISPRPAPVATIKRSGKPSPSSDVDFDGVSDVQQTIQLDRLPKSLDAYQSKK